VLAYRSIKNALKSNTTYSHRGKVVVLLKLHCLSAKDDQLKDETCTVIWLSRELRVSHLAQDQKGFGKAERVTLSDDLWQLVAPTSDVQCSYGNTQRPSACVALQWEHRLCNPSHSVRIEQSNCQELCERMSLRCQP
jgi:hypothetical protein